MTGLRSRLTLTLVALVTLTAAVLGFASYAFVDYSLHERMRSDAIRQANFNLSVLAPSQFAPDAARDEIRDSGFLAAVRQPGGIDALVDLGDGDPLVSDLSVVGLLDQLSPELRAIVRVGDVGWQSLARGDRSVLVVGGRQPGQGPEIYFVFDATATETALGQLRIGLVGGALVLLAFTLVAGRLVARGILRPVDAAGRAARRIARGDLAARLPVAGRDEFAAWATSFNEMAATLEETIGRLHESQAQTRRFVADVSHELRTPLTALVTEASLLSARLGDLPPDLRRPAELLVGDVGRLRELVEDLMELSRFDAAAEAAQLERLDLATLVAGIASRAAPAATVVRPAEPVLVETDRRRVERILRNLLDNAREHAPGTAIEVTVEEAADHVTVSVADRGPGVPTVHVPRLFERFYKADPSRHAGGSGLGLAIAAEHAELIGGRLSAANRDDGGLRVELRLPVTEPLPARDLPAMDDVEHPATSTAAQELIR